MTTNIKYTNNMIFDFSTYTDLVIHPDDYIIYKYDDVDDDDNKIISYLLCLDYPYIKYNECTFSLPRYNIISSNDNIALNKLEDDICEIITDKYTYKFKKLDRIYINAKNNMGGNYIAKQIDMLSITKNDKIKKNIKDTYYLEKDNDIINFYNSGKYEWSKIISLRHTAGIYFVLRDKILCVIDNGDGILSIYNLDGTEYKTIRVDMDYICTINIENDMYLYIKGFYWSPIHMKQYILIDSIFTDKIKSKTLSEHNHKYVDYDVNDIKIDELDDLE
jgi:hypothetical protein